MVTQEQFAELLNIQQTFDARIDTKNMNDTKVAYFVEFMEWANTIEFFKNWKQNKGKALEVQLDELSDLLAFGLSGYLQNYGNISEWLYIYQCTYEIPINAFESENFLAFTSNLARILQANEFDGFFVMLPILIAQRYYVNGEEQLFEAYKKKMQVNHERQNNGY